MIITHILVASYTRTSSRTKKAVDRETNYLSITYRLLILSLNKNFLHLNPNKDWYAIHPVV